VLVGTSSFSVWLDLGALVVSSAAMVAIGAALFQRVEAV